MPYSREIYDRAQEIIDERRTGSEEGAASRRAEFQRLEPVYKSLVTELARTVMETARTIGMGEKGRELVKELRKRNLEAQDNIKKLLAAHSLPPDYLEVKYVCPVCSDTGYDGGKFCRCRLDILKNLAYAEAGEASPLKFSSFEDFSLKYYPDEYDVRLKVNPHEHMASVLRFCREYARDFDPSESVNLLITGETGLGKTHLSLAITGEVIKKGYSVIYNSAQNIFGKLEKEHFGRGNDDSYESMVLGCDLLVMDDLGAEFSTTFTQACVYNIINTRIMSGKPTIISTNFNLLDLEAKYTKRVTSRIIGEYQMIAFCGNDVRQLKADE